ncbi:MAG: lipopolysaccharide biosynthesis protein [Acidimicrobiales bacterium]|nr:oligosaccharide flippase family protein [Hyphomonadaceae bacterium]RZV41055.1 MAG: lipopolysaccharide biosynthesis protein [Acidimicrobiales bacterium]
MVKSAQTVKAGAWVVSGKLCARLFDLALLLILSRLLTPDDFGLIALAMAPIFIGEAVLELPLVQALLRFDRPGKSMYDTAFTLSILRGLALATLFISLSVPLAHFYNEPRLTLLVCVLSLAPILRGTISPKLVIFMKEMDFRRDFLLDVFGKAVAFVVATTLAITTQSYWAIAAATITAPIAMNLLSYILAPYRPGFTLKDWKHFADMIGWNSLSQIIDATNWQMDRLLLGRFVPTEALGRYTIANDLITLPHRSFVTPLSRPLMANFTLQKTPDDLSNAYSLSLSAIFLLMAPILLMLSMLSEPIVLILLSEKWLEAAPIAQWLAAIGILSLPVTPLAPLALSQDRTRFLTLRAFLELIVKLPTMIYGVVFYGIWGAIGARAITAALTLVATLLIVRRLIGLSFKRQIRPLLSGGFSIMMMGGVMWFTRPDIGIAPYDKILIAAQLVVCCVLASITYLGSLYTIWVISGRPDGVIKKIVSQISSYKTRLLS